MDAFSPKCETSVNFHLNATFLPLRPPIYAVIALLEAGLAPVKEGILHSGQRKSPERALRPASLVGNVIIRANSLAAILGLNARQRSVIIIARPANLLQRRYQPDTIDVKRQVRILAPFEMSLSQNFILNIAMNCEENATRSRQMPRVPTSKFRNFYEVRSCKINLNFLALKNTNNFRRCQNSTDLALNNFSQSPNLKKSCFSQPATLWNSKFVLMSCKIKLRLINSYFKLNYSKRAAPESHDASFKWWMAKPNFSPFLFSGGCSQLWKFEFPVSILIRNTPCFWSWFLMMRSDTDTFITGNQWSIFNVQLWYTFHFSA